MAVSIWRETHSLYVHKKSSSQAFQQVGQLYLWGGS